MGWWGTSHANGTIAKPPPVGECRRRPPGAPCLRCGVDKWSRTTSPPCRSAEPESRPASCDRRPAGRARRHQQRRARQTQRHRTDGRRVQALAAGQQRFHSTIQNGDMAVIRPAMPLGMRVSEITSAPLPMVTFPDRRCTPRPVPFRAECTGRGTRRTRASAFPKSNNAPRPT